jgi:TIR domain
MAHVFLSYAREDRPRAEQIAHGLEAAGIEVFWDSEIPPGQTWADYIESKLTQCRALIVLWSEHSTKSQWVREEARLGRDKGKLIPAMLDNSVAPFGFGEVQAANLAGWNGEEGNADWRRFVDAVRTAAAIAPGAPPVRPPPSAPRPAMSAPPRPAPSASTQAPNKGVPAWAWVVGGVVGTILVIFALASMQTSPPAKPIDVAATTADGEPVAQPPVLDQPPAPSGENPQTIILTQLQQAQAAFANQGFQIVGQPFSGSLAQGQTWNVPAQLFAGVDYRVLDLVLFDPNGAIVSQDASTDSHPVVAVAPSYNGNFMVQVQMYNCSVAPCYYAVALYGQVKP